MKNRRTFLMKLAAGSIALLLVVAPVIADELIGVITKIDVEGKKLTVVENETEKETQITVNDDTEHVTKKGASKLDLEKLSKNLEKVKEKGRKGIAAKIIHDKGVASKIENVRKKAGN